jgi:hypothetical protein
MFTACLPTGVVCVTGTDACGTGCIDPLNDSRNCGGCGQACGDNQACNAGVCECQSGTTNCSGECVVLDSDSRHCGACATACATGEVCESTCKAACTIGSNIRCGGSCISPASDPSNCGGCGIVCASGQVCRGSLCTYDVVAACFSTGQVIGLSASTFAKGTLARVGTAPQSLAVMNGTLLSVDGFDRRLYQAVISTAGITQGISATAIGAVPTQVIVDGTSAYVVNAGTGTLQVLQAGVDAGALTLDAGVAAGLVLGTVAELNFGMNTFPEGAAKVGNVVWVPLNGGTGAAASAGQSVAKVLVSDPANPTEVGRVDLSHLDLHAFDGGAPVARPWSIVARNGVLYVVLNVLNPTTWVPEGPGVLARIDPATSVPTEVALAGADCLNPQWAQSVGGKLAVSCAGAATYDSSFNVVSVAGAGLVLLDEADQHLATWSSACPADAGPACAAMSPGRFTVSGQRVLLGDQNTGRVVVLDVSDAGLTEVRGVSNAVTTCPSRNVADLVTLP